MFGITPTRFAFFPDLERSIRDNELNYATYESGRTVFRMSIPRDGVKQDHRACLDGQMGILFKMYREWKLSGDDAWLAGHWATMKKVLAYAWSEENPDMWDRDRDGVLEGRQHHTLDMELFGPSSWLQGMYLAALKAAGEMAKYLGDPDAEMYIELYNKGYQWTKENLFNGEYFIQKINLKDKGVADAFGCAEGEVAYWYPEAGELKYQIGDGCEIDQILGQWHAVLCGLGDIFDPEQRKTALHSLYKYNFIPNMRDLFNTWRVFAVGDEAGTVMCTFPKTKPVIPLSYYSEVMTGFEYALAGLMIAEGMEEEGLTIVRAIRDRYDGKKRNPWNGFECGSNYARSMASYALLPIYCGLSYDLPKKKIGFAPIKQGDFACFFSVGTAWGMYRRTKDTVSLELREGYLELEQFEGVCGVSELCFDGKAARFICKEGKLTFDRTVIRRSMIIKLSL